MLKNLLAIIGLLVITAGSANATESVQPAEFDVSNVEASAVPNHWDFLGCTHTRHECQHEAQHHGYHHYYARHDHHRCDHHHPYACFGQ